MAKVADRYGVELIFFHVKREGQWAEEAVLLSTKPFFLTLLTWSMVDSVSQNKGG